MSTGAMQRLAEMEDLRNVRFDPSAINGDHMQQRRKRSRHTSAPPIVDFEQLLEQIRPIGFYQKRLWIIVAIALDTIIGMNMAMVMFAMKFPEVRCNEYLLDENGMKIKSDVVTEFTTNCSEIRELFSTCHADDLQFGKDSISTMATEFQMYCDNDRRWALSIMNYFQLAGVLLGALFWGQMGELFGRRKMLIAVYASCIAFGILTGFSVSWQMYAALLFGLGTAGGGFWCISFVIVQEIVGKKYRLYAAVLNGWPIGIMMFCFVAFLVKDWRWIARGINLFGLLFAIAFLYVYESPRWLLQHGDFENARFVINKIADTNGVREPNIEKYVETLSAHNPKPKYHSYWHLFHTKRMAVECLGLMFCWFTVSCETIGLSAYYGRNLPGDQYFNGFLRALLTGFFVWSLLIAEKYMSRKRMHQLSLGASCFFCLLVMLMTALQKDGDDFKDLITAFAVLGTAVMGPSWNIVYLYSVEMFPTVVRTLSNGLCSATARLGGMAAPFLVVGLSRWMSWAAFGPLCLAFLAAINILISVYILPETRRIPLLENLSSRFSDNDRKTVHFQTDQVECRLTNGGVPTDETDQTDSTPTMAGTNGSLPNGHATVIVDPGTTPYPMDEPNEFNRKRLSSGNRPPPPSLLDEHEEQFSIRPPLFNFEIDPVDLDKGENLLRSSLEDTPRGSDATKSTDSVRIDRGDISHDFESHFEDSLNEDFDEYMLIINPEVEKEPFLGTILEEREESGGTSGSSPPIVPPALAEDNAEDLDDGVFCPDVAPLANCNESSPSESGVDAAVEFKPISSSS